MRSPFQVLVIPFRRLGNGRHRFAVFRRSNGEYWQFVAGGGEDGETPLQAAKREASEEAGIALDAEYLPLDSTSTVPVVRVSGEYTWGQDVFVIPERALGVHVGNGTLVLSPEHTEYAWVRYEEALSLLEWDSNRNALWELNERLKREENSEQALPADADKPPR
jgi:dATP pyrophosphohydrolase